MNAIVGSMLMIFGTLNMWFAFALNRPGNFQAGGLCFVVCWFLFSMRTTRRQPRDWGIRKCPQCEARRLSGRGMIEHMKEAHRVKWVRAINRFGGSA